MPLRLSRPTASTFFAIVWGLRPPQPPIFGTLYTPKSSSVILVFVDKVQRSLGTAYATRAILILRGIPNEEIKVRMLNIFAHRGFFLALKTCTCVKNN